MAERVESVGRSNRSALRAMAEGAEVPELSIEEFEAVEFDRVKFSMYMALVAEAVPRRLGKGARDYELALDKQIARKVANLYRSVWDAISDASAPRWSSREERARLAATADLGPRRSGATVRWGGWLKNRHAELAELKVATAALAVAAGRPKWGVRRVRILTYEDDNIIRIVDDVLDRRRI